MANPYPLLSACDPRSCTAAQIMHSDRVISGIYRKHISPHGITASQLTLLFVTAKIEELDQALLSRIIGLEKSSLSRNLRRLVDDELIDKSTRMLRIKPKGKALLEQVIPSWEMAKNEVAELIGKDGVAALELLNKKLRIL